MDRRSIEFCVWGRYALFTDPRHGRGGEKMSYDIPTYEALKGITRSIYWKPTFVWVIDAVRVMNTIRTQTKAMKILRYDDSRPPDLSIYTYLVNVNYQVKAHFEWNLNYPELENDRDESKHHIIAKRSLDRGGRQDIFLGARDCQGYVEPCDFKCGVGKYDDVTEKDFGLMFHGFDYPEQTGENTFGRRLWRPQMKEGVIKFLRPEECTIRESIRRQNKVTTGSRIVYNVDSEFDRMEEE